MSVLAEAISVIVRRQSIDSKLNGGWDRFKELVPNQTLCFDDDLARIGFTNPADVEAFVNNLRSMGLQYVTDGEAVDLTVVDQLSGPLVNSPWLEVARLHLEDMDGQVLAIQLVGTKVPYLVTPDGWTYQGSFSQKSGFLSPEDAKRHLKYLRSEGGLDVYMDLRDGREKFIGRNVLGKPT